MSSEPQEQTTASGLRYIDFGGGDGATAKAGDHVSVHYTGTLENPRESEPLARGPLHEKRFSTSSRPVEASPIAQPERLFGQAVMRL